MARRKKLKNMTQEEIDALPIDQWADLIARDAFDRAEEMGELDKLMSILDKIPDEPSDRRRKK